MILGKIVGRGNTATIYLLEDNKVLKLFHRGYGYDSCYKEYINGRMINDYELSIPRVYDFITHENQYGIIYEYIKGQSLLEYLMNTKQVNESGILMASLHKELHRNKISELPSYKEFLIQMIPEELPLDKRIKLLDMIDELAEGDTICHGDFHPGNIILKDKVPIIIDFMNLCKGDYHYDMARTVYLVKYTPLPDTLLDREKEVLQTYRCMLVDVYLTEMGVLYEELIPYLNVIAITRRWECPQEESTYQLTSMEDIWKK